MIGKNKGRTGKTVRVLTVVAAAFFMLFAVGCNKDAYELFQPRPAQLTVADEYALKQYEYNSLSDVRTTLRADTMRVTKRNLKRAQPKLLSNIYTLSARASNGTNYSNYIEFTKYPSPSAAVKAEDFTTAAYEYAKREGIDTQTEQGKKEAVDKYFAYYKYMLMSQSTALLSEVKTASANGTLTQDNLYKHPAADSQYGEVIGTDNAVEKEIILDPIYRSHHATGLYLPAGEAVTVKVEGLKSGEKITVSVALNDSMGWRGSVSEQAKSVLSGMGADKEAAGGDYFTCANLIAAAGKFYDTFESGDKGFTTSLLSSQWNRQNSRMPRFSVGFEFKADGEYTIGSPFGGIMHITPNNCYSPVKTTFRGAVETPHYILGVTTPEYFDQYLKDPQTAPGVYSVLDTENGQLIGKASYMRNVATEEIESLAMLWHSFFAINESFTGGTYNRNNVVKFDQHVPAGAAVALGGMVYACPTGWYGSAMNYRSLINSGSWGILHEVGHSHGSAYGTVWGMGGSQEGEVRNNALTVLAYLKLLDIGTTRSESGNISAEHGFVAHPYTNLKKTLDVWAADAADFNNLEYFSALSIYVNIMHSFGVDKFYELLYSYKTNPSYNVTDENSVTIGNKRSDFIYRLATVYGMDFRYYANEVYSANAGSELFSAEQIAFMDALPVYHPVANFYAGGIDGVKTGGDYKINYGEDVVMDLGGRTITTAESFEILHVSQPLHGKITDLGEGKYSYTFNNDYFGNTDSFTFDVKLSDGVCHSLTVYLRLSYNGAQVTDYGAVSTGDIAAAESEIADKTPIESKTVTFAGIPNYTSQNKFEVRTSRFYYKAGYTGEHTFSARADDKARVYFGDNFEDVQARLSVDTYTSGFSDKNSFTVSLQKDKLYAVKIFNVNTGGQGGAALALKNASGNYVAVAAARIYSPSFEHSQKVEEYVFNPRFMVSKKDNALSGVMTTDKSDWTVVSAPDDISGGRYVTEEMKDEETGAVIGTITTDKRNYLIDGKTGTVFHTVWGNNATPATEEDPDVFIIDTNNVQQFNFFKITAPNRSDYRIVKYELQISSDNVNYSVIAAADSLEYKSTEATIRFTQTSGRYFKLIVKKTSANNSAYTVISQLDAGITSVTQLIFPSYSDKYYMKGWKRAAVDSDRRSGLLISEGKRAKLVIKFKGEWISLYSDKSALYGSATIKIDGKTAGQVNLSDAQNKSRQLVFHAEGLKNKEHTMEIITLTDAPFNLDFVGASFNAFLINASNIYLERALAVALTVFIILFVLTAAALCIVLFVPSVRKKVLDVQPKAKKAKAVKEKKVKPAKAAKPKKPSKSRASKSGASKRAAGRASASVGFEDSYEDYVEEVPIGDIFQTTSLYQEELRRKSAAVQPGVFTADVETAASKAAAAETAAAKSKSSASTSKPSAAPAQKTPTATKPTSKSTAAKSASAKSEAKSAAKQSAARSAAAKKTSQSSKTSRK